MALAARRRHPQARDPRYVAQASSPASSSGVSPLESWRNPILKTRSKGARHSATTRPSHLLTHPLSHSPAHPLALRQELSQFPQTRLNVGYESNGLESAPIGQFGADRGVNIYTNSLDRGREQGAHRDGVKQQPHH